MLISFLAKADALPDISGGLVLGRTYEQSAAAVLERIEVRINL